MEWKKKIKESEKLKMKIEMRLISCKCRAKSKDEDVLLGDRDMYKMMAYRRNDDGDVFEE